MRWIRINGTNQYEHMARNNSDPIGTLSIGNVVTIGTILYKSNFKRYLSVSLQATAWGLAILGLTIGATASSSIILGMTKSRLASVPIWVGWVGFTLYFLAHYATTRAAICRLAYQELIDAPETVMVATQNLRSRMWGLLRVTLLVALYMFFVFVISSIVLIIMPLILLGSIVSWLNVVTPDVFMSICILVAMVGLLFAWSAILLRYYAYWFVAELPLTIESTRSASFSIRRSSQLTVAAIGRVTFIVTIAFLLILPLNLVGGVPAIWGNLMTNPLISPDLATQSSGRIVIGASVLLNIIIELFLMPFWQTVKAVVYYDLRNRREGEDLTI
jgi:hypothetical protein